MSSAVAQPASKQPEKEADEPGSLTHPSSVVSRECPICLCDFEKDGYVEFQRHASNPKWYPVKCCVDCTRELMKRAWSKFHNLAENERCPKAWSAVIARGPPSRLYEDKVLPNPEAKNERGFVTGEVHALWFASDNHTETGELPDALRGDALAKWWARVVARKRVIKASGEAEMLPIEPEAPSAAMVATAAAAVTAATAAAAAAPAAVAASAASAVAVTASLQAAAAASTAASAPAPAPEPKTAAAK